MIELACDELVFHFNKKHLEDSTIPMWVIKAKGETYYVNHVDSSIPWSTKETPDNPHTKGSLKFKHCYCSIDDNNIATIRELTDVDKARLRAKEKGHTRVIFQNSQQVQDFFKSHDIKYTPVKAISGGCGNSFYICDIVKQDEAAFALIGLGHKIRSLRENETYWKAYDDDKLRASLDADYIDISELYEEDDDE